MTTPAIPPPAGDDVQHEDMPATPSERVQRAKWEAVVRTFSLLIGALTDWLGIAAVCYMAPIQHWSPEMTWTALIGLASGTVVAKLRGKVGGSTAALLLTGPTVKLAGAAATILGRGSHIGTPWVAALLAVLVSGCAGMDLPSPEVARIAANKTAEAMNRLGPVLVAVCTPEPRPAWCADAIGAFNDVAQAHGLTQDFVDVYSAVSR